MRRFFQTIFALLALLVLAAAGLPWWLGWAIEPVARTQGVTFSRYERLGYARFRLHEVRYNRNSVEVRASQVEAATPLLWLVSRDRRQATVGEWAVIVQPSPRRTDPGANKITGVPSLYDLLDRVAGGLAHWLPNARLGAGQISWPRATLQLASAEWRDRTLTVNGLGWRNQLAEVTAVWPASGPVSIEATATHWNTQLKWLRDALHGAGAGWQQPWTIEARFPRERWMPTSAALKAENWQLDAALLKLGPDYAFLQGKTHVAWSEDHFDFSADARAVPREGAASASPLEARLAARGDTRGATITAFHVAAPFATANLSAPVSFDYAGGLQTGAAQLAVVADLAKQPWFAAQGQVRGTVGISASQRQEFNLECNDIQIRDLNLQRASARGALVWPRLELTGLEITPDHESQLSATGAINLVTRELFDVALQARLAGGWFDRWLPAGAGWTRAEITANASGPLAAPTHSGKAVVLGAGLRALQPMDIEVSWSGRGLGADDFIVGADTHGARVEAAGAFDSTQVHLRAFSLTRAGQTPWSLAAPARISWTPSLRIDGLRLEHAGGFLSLTSNSGPDGRWRLEASNIESALLRDWLKLPGPDWRVKTVNSDASVIDGKLGFTIQLNGEVSVESQAADIRLLARGDAAGVQIEELSTTVGDRVVTRADGNIPVVWNTRTSPHLQPDWNAPLTIAFHTTPDSPLWSLLAGLAGVTVEKPVAESRLGGTLENPKASLKIQASRVALARGDFKDRVPEITDLVLEARADGDGLIIDQFQALLDGQKVQAQGRLPTGRDDWEKVRQSPVAFLWNHGTGHIEVTDADLSQLAKRAPDFMAAQGRLSARLDLAAGGALSGELRLRNAALRPIDPLGTVQEINADLALRDRQLEIKSWAAKLGGEPVELRGTIALPANEVPRVALELQGKNLPLVRRTGLIVRSDIDLKATTGSNDVTEVTGLVTLRDSVVLADLSVLRPTGQSSARLRPPFFSVDVEPFRNWSLAVDLRGSEAVKIRMPVFTGVASTRFRLSGTLGEPRAVGELTVDQGRVLFPFATFDVRLGSIRLSEADPYRAQVNVNAQSRYHDYLLHLDATGPLEAPQVVLSSNPPLDATQLLLMVTSGQSPETDEAAASGTQRLARLGTYFGQSMFLGSDTNRIELSSGSQVSREGKETYEFTYRLNDRWALVGDYDEYDEYNAGLKWRAYVQEGDKREKK